MKKKENLKLAAAIILAGATLSVCVAASPQLSSINTLKATASVEKQTTNLVLVQEETTTEIATVVPVETELATTAPVEETTTEEYVEPETTTEEYVESETETTEPETTTEYVEPETEPPTEVEIESPTQEKKLIWNEDSDFRHVAALIYAEAGNQCEAGQRAVGIVLMNRVSNSEFADTIYGVIHEKGQFACINDGNLDRAYRLYDSGQLPDVTLQAAAYVLNGGKTVYYGAEYDMSDYHFFSRYVSNARLVIEDHQFK